MKSYLIEKMSVVGLWGYKDISVQFDPNVNILIGPNGSGKTTLLTLLDAILTVDLFQLAEVVFKSATITLAGFGGGPSASVSVERHEDVLIIRVNAKTVVSFPLHVFSRPYIPQRLRDDTSSAQNQVYKALGGTVPIVWLPVNRRLPDNIAEDLRRSSRMRNEEAEPVNARLESLFLELISYRLQIQNAVEELNREFVRQVLETMLFNKAYDRLQRVDLEPPTEVDKRQLIRAFEQANILNASIQRRIDEHFSEVTAAAERLTALKAGAEIDPDDLFIFPLNSRTKKIANNARHLEERREDLFTNLLNYERSVNWFLKGKKVKVQDSGKLQIILTETGSPIDSAALSSGEKQILILLTQALLCDDRPVIYIADEPELSLHVTWQERLLSSLQELGKEIQIIVATHSPDIVGPFRNKMIELGKELK